MSEQLIGFMAGFALLIAGWCFTVYMRSVDRRATVTEKMELRIVELERQVLTLDFPVKLLWAKAQQNAADALHHPKPRFKEMDDLLDKLNLKDINQNGDILPMTDADTARLKELLFHRTTDMSEGVTDYEREQAKIMPILMDNKIIEEQKGTGTTPLNVELVGEAPKPDESEGK